MPLETNIILQGRVLDAMGAMQKGQNLRDNILNAPLLREQMANQNANAPLLQEQLRAQNEQLANANKMSGLNQQVTQQSIESEARKSKMQKQVQSTLQGQLYAKSGNYSALVELSKSITDPNDQNSLASTAFVTDLAQKAQAGDSAAAEKLNQFFDMNIANARSMGILEVGGSLQKGPGGIVQVGDKAYFATPVFNGTTGATTTSLTPVGGELLSREGETPEEKSARLARQAGDAKTSELNARINLEPTLQGDITTSSEGAKAMSGRREEVVNQGLAAVDELTSINKLIKLNSDITGGKVENWKKAATDVFGQTGAPIGQFENLSRQLVLTKIKKLGSNPTEGEREFILSTVTSLQAGKRVNAAILSDMKTIAQRQIARAKKIRANPKLDPADAILDDSGQDDFKPTYKPDNTPSVGQPKYDFNKYMKAP